jgi:hypothetical protein
MFNTNSFANIGEHFGASSESIAIAGQATFDPRDPSNGFYAAAILAYDEKTSYSYSEIALQTDFKDINNIITDSPINSAETSDVYGDVDTSSNMKLYRSFHGSFKLFKEIPSKLNISVFLPSENFMEVRTGDPYRPEYVMYESRFNRTIGYVSYAQKLRFLNFSIGMMTGLQSNGETFIIAKDTGSTTPSSGKMQFNAKPSAALNFSISKKWNKGISYFSFQDEMKSKLENSASGITPIGNVPLQYAWDLSSMLFYDPQIFRIGHKYKNLIATLEYQDWSGYETPILKLKAKNSSILISSKLEENFKTKPILIPRVGYLYQSFSFGLAYRPSPLELKQGASGNTVDTDSLITSVGYKKPFKLLSQDFLFKSGLSMHFLKTQTVKKDPNRENGTTGNKIGYPKYEIGGNVYALSIGLSWVL